MAHQEGTHFLVRTCVNRLVKEGESTIDKEMKKLQFQGFHCLKVRNKNGEEREVMLGIKYHSLTILPPIAKKKQYPSLYLSVIHAQEIKAPEDENKDRDCLVWKLITDLPVNSLQEA